MAELATIARPYAEALFRAGGDRAALLEQLQGLALLGSSGELRQFADNPKVTATQVFDLLAGVALQKGLAVDSRTGNLLRAVLDNGRLPALAEIAAQYGVLVHSASGVHEATLVSAFPLSQAQVDDLMPTLERRFGRKLDVHVEVDASLIGGVRAVVGDEVLDLSVKARLEQMKAALTA
jgi:F-type H+-transporting ATPase subunit delta